MRMLERVAPSYRVLAMSDFAGAAAALSLPDVSVVELARSQATLPAWESWPDATHTDIRVQLSVADAAAAGPGIDRLLASHFGCAPPAVRGDMLALLQLFAQCAIAEGGAAADTTLNGRLVVSNGVRGACSQLHYDSVTLRLSCAYHGAGTRYLPEASVNRAAFIALQRRGTLPGWLQRALVQPWGWIVYNGLVRWPWGEERAVPEGHAILMKGSRWWRGKRRPARSSPLPFAALGGTRAGPALHRSPIAQAGDAGVESTLRSGRRVLFTVDY